MSGSPSVAFGHCLLACPPTGHHGSLPPTVPAKKKKEEKAAVPPSRRARQRLARDEAVKAQYRAECSARTGCEAPQGAGGGDERGSSRPASADGGPGGRRCGARCAEQRAAEGAPLGAEQAAPASRHLITAGREEKKAKNAKREEKKKKGEENAATAHAPTSRCARKWLARDEAIKAQYRAELLARGATPLEGGEEEMKGAADGGPGRLSEGAARAATGGGGVP